MSIETIVVLLLTAFTLAVLVWIELKSRRNQVAATSLEGKPEPIAASAKEGDRRL